MRSLIGALSFGLFSFDGRFASFDFVDGWDFFRSLSFSDLRFVDSDEADLFERDIEAMLVRVFMADGFDGSCTLDDDDGETER